MIAHLPQSAAPSEGQQHFGRAFLAVGLSLLVHVGIVAPDLIWSVASGAREARVGASNAGVRPTLTAHLVQRGVPPDMSPDERARRHVDTAATGVEDRPATNQTAGPDQGPAVSALGQSPLPDLPVGRQYYRSSELDEKPKPKSQVEPEFPLVVDPGVIGRVIARLFIDDEGRVERVVVEEAEPAGLFEQSVQTAFAGARYSPGIKRGRPVASQIRIEIEFRSNPLK